MFLPLCWRCPAAPHSLHAGDRALGGNNRAFQHFPHTYTLMIFKNASLIQSLLGAQGGPGWARWLCRLRLLLVPELLGKAGECVCLGGGEYGEAAGYFGRCKRGANSPAFIFQPAGADSGCFLQRQLRGAEPPRAWLHVLAAVICAAAFYLPHRLISRCVGHWWCF